MTSSPKARTSSHRWVWKVLEHCPLVQAIPKLRVPNGNSVIDSVSGPAFDKFRGADFPSQHWIESLKHDVIGNEGSITAKINNGYGKRINSHRVERHCWLTPFGCTLVTPPGVSIANVSSPLQEKGNSQPYHNGSYSQLVECHL